MHPAAGSLPLQEINAMYESLVNHIPAVVYVGADDEVSSNLYISPQVEEMLGYTPEEWVEDSGLWAKLLHPEDRERVLLKRNRARTTGETFEEEYRLVGLDVRVVWVHHDKAVRVEAQDKTFVVWQGVMLDVTERKRVEKELLGSEKLFKRTFEDAGVGMAHVTPDGRWLRVNDKLCEISGYPREELLERTFLELTPPEDQEKSAERVHRMLAGELGPYSIERRYIRKDGSRVWVDLSVSLVRKTAGEPDFFICVAEDITERKIAELVPEPLTDGELEVLHHIAVGKTNPQIAENLCHSLGTVKLYVRRLIAKLGASDRKSAAKRAIETGLIPPPRC